MKNKNNKWSVLGYLPGEENLSCVDVYFNKTYKNNFAIVAILYIIFYGGGFIFIRSLIEGKLVIDGLSGFGFIGASIFLTLYYIFKTFTLYFRFSLSKDALEYHSLLGNEYSFKREDIKKIKVNCSKSTSYVSIIIFAGDTKIKLIDSFCENLTELLLFIKENYDDVTDVKIII